MKLSHPTPTDIVHSFGHLVAQLDATLAATYEKDGSNASFTDELFDGVEPRARLPDSEVSTMLSFKSTAVAEQAW